MKWLLVSILLLSFACKSNINANQDRKNVPHDKNIHVVIKYAQSNETDITKGTYTVFFMSKPPVNIPFQISDTEKAQISDRYYSLSIDALNEIDPETGTVTIEDECMIMPKLYTLLTVQKAGVTQRIEIDESCRDYSSANKDKVERVKEFIRFIEKIILTKPEIKNAPQSDVIYM